MGTIVLQIIILCKSRLIPFLEPIST